MGTESVKTCVWRFALSDIVWKLDILIVNEDEGYNEPCIDALQEESVEQALIWGK